LPACLSRTAAPDDELADPPFAEPAADEDALCVAPRREFQETLDYLAKRMRKVLDGADQRSRHEWIAAQEDFFQFLLLLVELLRRDAAQRVDMGDAATPAIEHRLEGLLVGMVAQKRAILAELDIVIIRTRRAQLARAVGEGPIRGE
jgi:hypothetical protein